MNAAFNYVRVYNSFSTAFRFKEIRGKGLLNAIEIDETSGIKAWDICLNLAQHGILAKPTHGHIIRFAPPLVITENEMDTCLHRMEQSLLTYA